MLLNQNWKFIREDVSGACAKDFNDSAWRVVNVPHDYAVEGPFAPENDKQYEGVAADGLREKIVHIARTGGLPSDVPAWYRKNFTVSDTSKHVFLQFDGVMANAVIYVNGIACGERAYGYSSFAVDVTDACTVGENVVAVSLKPEGSSSRFYSGAGIYRNVRLLEKNEIFFPYCNTFVNPSMQANQAILDCTVKVENFGKPYTLTYLVKDASGKEVARAVESGCDAESNHIFKLKGYAKWNVGDSYMYTLETVLTLQGEDAVMDTNTTPFGIRTIRFDGKKGFFLNEKNVKLKGVCLHHDLGALGGAFNKAAARRQLEKLIDIGTNAVRMTHNPPAPEMLDLCDELGLLVIDEAFDEWSMNKVTNGYAKHFDKWAKSDLLAMLHRDRNHPSVIMWSIGNEILEQCTQNGWHVCKFLADICHAEDRSRPVTAGFNKATDAFGLGMYAYVDVVGVNYKPHLYESFHNAHPDLPLYGSETESCVTSRGEYGLPHQIPYKDHKKENFQLDSYDFCAPPWAYFPEHEFLAQDKFEYIFGEFVWTGFDYLGEPTPYREEWPSRSSYFGIYDLAGLPKDRVYSYMSKWTNKEVMHLFPHWNWNEGDVIDVYCYSNYDEVELFVNGESHGISVKDPTDELARHRHTWRDITFAAGEIKAVAVRNPSVVDVIKTAYEPTQIVLQPERKTICADGDDLVYVECSLVDANGTHCPVAQNALHFSVSGAGRYVASDAGDATSLRTFTEPYCELYNGKCVVIVGSVADCTGDITVTVSAEGLPEASCTVVAE